MRKKLQNWMTGRYGSDELSFTLLILYLGVCIFAVLARLKILQLLALGLILWSLARILSRNSPARQAENEAYLNFLRSIGRSRRARQERKRDKAHRYYRCRQCGAMLRLPRGVGKVEITCPRCGKTITKKA